MNESKPDKSIRILAIESSCDETAAAVVADGRQVLSNVISSQIAVHREYGGVVPEIASRNHLLALTPVVEQALADAACTLDDIQAVAVSHGPGLAGALLVGVSYAKALAYARQLPLIAVHHWQGHVAAIEIEHRLEPPYLALVVSGSHSGLLLVGEQGGRLLGCSHDDAAGEAFDKIARALGLPYPGGPEIERAAAGGDAAYVDFPRAWLPDSDDFSFSGLKSAVLNYLHHREQLGDPPRADEIKHIAAAAQQAICDVLSWKAVLAARREGLKQIVLVGGVAANGCLRRMTAERAAEQGITVSYPAPVYCTDNAAMIGVAAYRQYAAGDFADMRLNACPRLPLPVLAAGGAAEQ
ncbi:MAG: tRNA (adenosine(37)-N6)-threonylcarbamoyltransferase complex transferase subunit TsaD [Bacillota bacterium]|nr:tRNA (adenosine(37)-N6)-threonylcarbamoyltransferase complex transferase subunit TsaD [Bacillota bacterium]